MINKEQIKQNVKDWILNFVSKPQERLGGLAVCPYAKKTLLDKQIEIIPYDGPLLFLYLNRLMEQWDDSVEILCILDLNKNDAGRTKEAAEMLNEMYNESDDLVILVDFPEPPFLINGVNTSFPEFPLILIQRLSILNKATKELNKTSYYSYWTNKQIAETILWRLK